MPALRLFGRRWMMGTDDVPLLALVPTVFHGVWCVVLLVGWLVLNRPSDCKEGIGYDVALAGLFFTFLANFVLGVWLMWEGLKGSIFEAQKRWLVEPLLKADLAVFTVELGFVVYGTVVRYQTPPGCLNVRQELWSPDGVMSVMIWMTWAVLLLSLALLLATYNFFPDFQDERSWERRCRLVTACCCCKIRNPEPHGEDAPPAPYTRLAALFSQIFGVVDLVPTDVLAAFLLAASLQRLNRAAAIRATAAAAAGKRAGGGIGEARESAATSSSVDASAGSQDAMLQQCGSGSPQKMFTPSGMAAQMLGEGEDALLARHAGCWDMQPVADEDLEEAAHYCRYAFAAYGYLLYIWSQPQYRGWCDLCCGRGFGLWLSPLRRYFDAFRQARAAAAVPLPEIKINNAMNREAMQQMTGLDDRDIVFVRYVNEAKDKHCLPYLVAVDASTHSVVVSIRGTLSLEDCLTDFMCEPAALNQWLASGPAAPDREDARPALQIASRSEAVTAHAGMLAAAKAVVADILETGELQGLLENRLPKRRAGSPRRGGRSGEHPTHDCRGWRVVVTGHSLGAGVAVLVALYLRKLHAGVFCWAFCPPGGLAEPALAEASRAFCTSVALGKDWIPRLTLASFEHLRDEMIVAAARCRVNKTWFLLGHLFGRRWTPERLFAVPEVLSWPAESRELLATYRKSIQRSTSTRERYEQARTFILPGRLMYLRPLKARPNTAAARRRYDAVWAAAGDLHGEGILVSPRMMADHMPDHVTKVLGKLARARRRSNPSWAAAAGPAVGSGAAHVSGPARSQLAIDVDSESEAGDAEFVDDLELGESGADSEGASGELPRPAAAAAARSRAPSRRASWSSSR